MVSILHTQRDLAIFIMISCLVFDLLLKVNE